MLKEKVSVIIPTVNAYEELDLALLSIKKNSDHEVEFLVVVDPDMNTGIVNKDILAVCKKQAVTPIINKENHGPYGNWNIGAARATSNWLIFATDDQYFAPHWDSNLLKYYIPQRLVAGRLIEPGIIPVWKTNIKKDFGVLPSEFKEKEFIAWCANQKEEGFVKDGFFIPMLQHKDDYKALGGYPTAGKFGTSTAVSNDVLYVQSALKKGYQFGTATDSYSYHFQASSWKKKTLKPKIAGVVLTLNEEESLGACLDSLKWTTDNYVVDSGSLDKTLEIAKKKGAVVLKNKFVDFAAQRNFALSKLGGYDWVFMLDADEACEASLAKELAFFAKDIYLDGVVVPRKNYIFGRFIEHSDWYPDGRMVFFRPKLIEYQSGVHERAKFVKGNETTAFAKGHILHRNYHTVREFLLKNLVDYPYEYALVLDSQKKKFVASDLLLKPIGEFMRRFFLAEGYKDGLYGLVLSSLMGAQTLSAYAYLWELQGKRKDLTTEETQEIFASLKMKTHELKYWLISLAIEKSGGLEKYYHRLRRKTLKIMKGMH
ncbi:MAG: Glycosyl transferase family 2 [Microgenomates group bacterium GW2011_GWF2_47_9]|nr:MAG: Glycosyl transferase family 2 [Microgenomates group bacterium GW2011_GWF2_47_9]